MRAVVAAVALLATVSLALADGYLRLPTSVGKELISVPEFARERSCTEIQVTSGLTRCGREVKQDGCSSIDGGNAKKCCAMWVGVISCVDKLADSCPNYSSLPSYVDQLRENRTRACNDAEGSGGFGSGGSSNSTAGSSCDISNIQDVFKKCKLTSSGSGCSGSNVSKSACCKQLTSGVNCLKSTVGGCNIPEFSQLLDKLQGNVTKYCGSSSGGGSGGNSSSGGGSGSGGGGGGGGGDDSSTCFPAHATVRLEDGSVRRMDELSVGDRVLVAGGKYSDVFAFGHRHGGALNKFVRVEAGDSAVEMSAVHYIPVNGRLVTADKVKAGDVVVLGDGQAAAVSAVRAVMREGLYNPHTMEGTIVVDGVLASTYTRVIDARLAHVLLAVPRALYRLGVKEPLGAMLHNAAPAAVLSSVPRGPSAL